MLCRPPVCLRSFHPCLLIVAVASLAVGSLVRPDGTALAAKTAAERHPNFIVIMTDDQGYGDLSCFGSDVIETPHIDRMAEEGCRFLDFYVPAPLCTPSRAGLLTGCYPKRVGLAKGVLRPDSQRGLAPSEITIAEVLKPQGYATGCIGKWHLGFLPALVPTSQGFDHYYGLMHNQDKWEAIHFEEEGGVPLLRNGEVVCRPAPGEVTELYTAEALAFIERHRDRPFFLYLAHTMPHDPIGASDRFAGRSEGGLYGDVIECLDWSTGEILDTIRRLDLADSTYVFYFSDNGPSGINSGSSGPLRGRKHTTFEGGLRVPMVAWAPGRIPAGTICRAPVLSLDLLPTLGKLAGTGAPTDRVIDGQDITAVLAAPDTASSPHQAILYYNGAGRLDAIRQGRWKLHLHRKGKPVTELYDLQTDIGEQTDVSAGHPEMVERLRQKAREMDAAITQRSP